MIFFDAANEFRAFLEITLRKLTPLTTLLPLAVAVLLSHADLAQAQNLTLTPNPLNLSIAGPGLATSATVTVSSQTQTISSASVGTINYSAGASGWLCAATSNLTITFSVGPGSSCGASSAGLVPGIYNAAVPVNAVGGAAQTNLQVSLTVGTSTGGVGLTATPNPVTFNVALGRHQRRRMSPSTAMASPSRSPA